MRKRIIQSHNVLLLILILAFSIFLITMISLLIIYNNTINTYKAVLTDMVESDKTVIVTLAEKGLSEDAVAQIMKKSHARLQSIGKTGEFVIADLNGKVVTFLLNDNIYPTPTYEQIMTEKAATPLKMAFTGKSGFVRGKDYRNVEVLAGYAFVKGFDWGIVAKIDVSEVNRPFRDAAYIAAGLAMFCMISGSILFILITNPMIGRIIRSENKFRSLFDSSTDEIMIADFAGHCLEVNEPACLKLQYSRDELISMSLRDINSPEFRGRCDEIIKKLPEIGFMSYETEHMTKTGQIIPVEVRAKVVDYNKSKAILKIARDITERKRTEAALRESNAMLEVALASMTDAVFISDAEGRFINLNEAFVTFYRFKNKADCARTLAEYPVFLEVYLPNGEPAPLDQWAVPRALRGEICTNAEYTLRRKDTGETWVGSYSFSPIRNKDNAIVGAVVTARDITDRKRTELKILRLNEELEQRVRDRTVQLEAANKELEAFAYSVSHDLRAPLRGIDGWSLALLEDYQSQLDERACQYIERVRSETQRMGQLIDDLLQLSRVTRSQIQKAKVNLSALAQTIVKHLQETQPARQFDISIAPGLTAMGDDRLLEIALINLFNNAFKFTGKLPLARIEFGKTIVDGRQVFFIRDNGAGFDMAYSTKLFGAFQRMHKQTEFPGTGVGLATVQRIIHRHAGRIWAEAKVDQGATFYFTINEAS